MALLRTVDLSEDKKEEVTKDKITAKSLLDTVNEAIMTVMVGGQSYKIGSRNLTRADLHELIGLKDKLAAEVASESKSSLFDDCYVALFDRR